MNQMLTQGKFITVEGIEGVGKSTAVSFIQDFLTKHQIDVCFTREPGGTVIAEEIRAILLKHHDEKMSDDTELLLMFASRAQHVSQLIKPRLAQGIWVLCDRFTDASFAYQGGGRGIDISRIQVLADWVLSNFQPDHVILLDAPVEVALARAHQRSEPDRIEQEKQAFFERVRRAYLVRAAEDKARYHIVDASTDLASVQARLAAVVEEIIGLS